jgi:hypothetical protein
MSDSVDEHHRAWWLALPPFAITYTEAKKLSEYSATNPTGVVVGKMWRRDSGAYDEGFKRKGGKPRWVICRYEEAPPKLDKRTGRMLKMCSIATYRAVIRVPMCKVHT